MKKYISAILTVLMVLSVLALPVQAAKEQKVTAKEEKTTAREEKTQKTAVLDSALVSPAPEKKPMYEGRGSASGAVSSDSVTIDAESREVGVVTAAGTQLYLTVPVGACCVTQDVYRQLDQYMSLYADVGAALKFYITNGIHMDIYDLYTGTSTCVAELDDPLADQVGEMNGLKDSQLKPIMNYMSKNWYGGCPAVIKTAGENTYIAFDLSAEYGFVVYNHITNGKLIEVYTFCESGAGGMSQLESMIEGLRFDAEAEEEPLPDETEAP